jgi:hypothetical protein
VFGIEVAIGVPTGARAGAPHCCKAGSLISD